MNWFEEWFDSPLYEKLYAYRNKDEADELADLVEHEIPVYDYPSILDLGCGRGRHAITFAERGYRVTGLDLSDQAILQARRFAKEKELDNVQFQVGDMRRPLEMEFDAILNLFTTFGYFLKDDENTRVISSVSRMLKPGGVFILDYLNARQVRENLVPEEEESFRDMSVHIQKKIKDNMVYKTITFSGDKLRKPIEYQERVKLYGLDWFRKNLEKVDLTLTKTYGSYNGEPFNENESPRLIMISERE